MQLVKSLIFTAYMMVSALLVGALMSLCFWAPYAAQFKIARTWARNVMWVLDKVCGLKFTVEGRERIPAGNHIVMANHTSAWETIAQFLIFPPQVWVLKRELLWIPCIGWGMKLLRPISINRGAGHRAVNQVLEQGKAPKGFGLSRHEGGVTRLSASAVRVLDFPAPPTLLGEELVAQYRHEPSDQIGPGSELSNVSAGTQQGVLHEVFGPVRIA